jgi:hypothetical protein
LQLGARQHAGRDIGGDHQRLRVTTLQRTGCMPGTGTEIEDGLRHQFELRQPPDELHTHAFLQRRRRVITPAGAVESLRHRTAIE